MDSYRTFNFSTLINRQKQVVEILQNHTYIIGTYKAYMLLLKDYDKAIYNRRKRINYARYIHRLIEIK